MYISVSNDFTHIFYTKGNTFENNAYSGTIIELA